MKTILPYLENQILAQKISSTPGSFATLLRKFEIGKNFTLFIPEREDQD